MRLSGWQLIVGIVLLIASVPQAAFGQQILRVPQDVGDLGTAIQQISNGGIIEMAGGTYAAPASGGFRIRFVGKSFTIRAAAGATVSLNGQGSSPIMLIEDSSPDRLITLEGLTFVNGFSDQESVAGAVTIRTAAAHFTGCAFRDNTVVNTGSGGGAVRVLDGSEVTFATNTWSNNTARNRGGALSVLFSNAIVRRDRFTNNRVNLPGHTDLAVGGGIYVLDATLRVEESRFENNQGALSGGAIYGFGIWEDPVTVPKTEITVLNSTFVGNEATPDPCCPLRGNMPASGGAIHVEDQTRLVIQHSRFRKNRGNWGGALSSYRADIEVSDSVFRGNVAEIDRPIPALGGTIVMTSADGPGPSTDFGAINRPTGSLRVQDSLLQGRFQDVTGATATQGGCLAACGDLNRLFGNVVPQDGDAAKNRIGIDLERVILTDCEVALGPSGGAVSGGGVGANLADLKIEDSLIVDNDSPTVGGGIFTGTQSTTEIIGTTIADNRAQEGAGIGLDGSHLDVRDSQFILNEESPGVSQTLVQSRGASIFSLPFQGGGQPERARSVSGRVESSLFVDEIGLPLFDGDFAQGPINDLRYDGNRFGPTTFTDRVFRNTVQGAGLTAAGLNDLVVMRSNGTSTDKSQVANQALGTAPNAGALVAAPSAVLTTSAVGDPAPPTSAFLGYAWRGSSATLAGQNLTSPSGLIQVTTADTYTLRVGGATIASVTVDEEDSGANCKGTSSGLCLNGDRFLVEVEWRDFEGNVGIGEAVPAPSIDSGLFFFFSEDNWEMLVKVLFGCPINNHYWVFAAATTNVEYTLRVTDVVTGRQVSYFNPLGNAAAAVTDTNAFDTCSANNPGKSSGKIAGRSHRLLIRLDDPPSDVLVEPFSGNPELLTLDDPLVSSAACPLGGTQLLLNNQRFRVEVDWLDFQGGRGVGEVVPFCTSDSGLFFFFNKDNWEMLVKVLFGCPINNHYWVFAAATTNVEYTLRVVDTQSGEEQVYFNPLGNAAAAVTDILAFETCP